MARLVVGNGQRQGVCYNEIELDYALTLRIAIDGFGG